MTTPITAAGTASFIAIPTGTHSLPRWLILGGRAAGFASARYFFFSSDLVFFGREVKPWLRGGGINVVEPCPYPQFGMNIAHGDS